MNDFAKRWVAALRSGEYKQGYQYLHCGNEFCVMGVACDLMRNELHIEMTETLTDRYGHSGKMVIERFDGFVRSLPNKVMSKLGFKSWDYRGVFQTKKGEEDNLMRLNDSGVPFTRLADLIEQYQEQLFHE